MRYRAVPDDREVCAALSSRNPAATAQVYDRYSYGLYGYACGFVDGSTATDVVHDSVWIATRRIDALRDPGLLRAWLYAIVRSECARPTRAGGPVGFVPATDSAALLGPDVAAVRDAVNQLRATEREVVELSMRHHLAAHEIGAILGSAAGDGRLLAHAQDAVDTAVPDVPNAGGLFASLPLVPIPPRLRDRVLAAVPLDAELTAMGRRIDPVDRNGFPVRGRGHRGSVAVAASVVGVLALAVVALVVLPDSAPAELPASRPGAERLVDLGSAPATTSATTSATTTTTAATTTEPTTQVVEADPTTTTAITTSAATATSTPSEPTSSESTRFPRRTKPVDDAPTEEPVRGGDTTTRTPQPTTTREPATPPDFPSFPSLPTRGNG